MALDFQIIRRQRKLGAFPTADAMRAAKAAAQAASVTLDPTLSVATPEKSVPDAPKKKSA
jgi:hypothetical protein